MKLLLTALVFYFIGFITVRGTINVCIPYESVDVKDTDQLLEEINHATAELFEEQPIPIEHIDLDINHPAIRIRGPLDNLLIYNINEFEACFLDNINIFTHTVDLFNITFPNITVTSEYNITGDLGDLFDIFGDGHFRITLANFSIAMNNFTINSTNGENCFRINIDLDMDKVNMTFTHFMGDEEIGDLFNRAFSYIAPESIRIIWSEIKDIFDKPIEDAINNFFHRNNMTGILHLLHNIASVENVANPLFCFSGSSDENESKTESAILTMI